MFTFQFDVASIIGRPDTSFTRYIDPDVVSFTLNCVPADAAPKSAIRFCVFDPLNDPVKVVSIRNAVCVWLPVVLMSVCCKLTAYSCEPDTTGCVSVLPTDNDPVITVLPIISNTPFIAPVDFPIATCEPVIHMFGVAVGFENKYNDCENGVTDVAFPILKFPPTL